VCTVGWAHQTHGYHLLCNRDERRTRETASAPRVVERGGVRYIAPVDSDGGGTWLSADEFGISVCLLNGGASVEPSGIRRAAGYIAARVSLRSIRGRVCPPAQASGPQPFAPFSIVILEPGRSAILSEWNGLELIVDPAGDRHMPLTSSSYGAAGVRRARLNEFARLIGVTRPIDPALLCCFHSSHGTGPDAYSSVNGESPLRSAQGIAIWVTSPC